MSDKKIKYAIHNNRGMGGSPDLWVVYRDHHNYVVATAPTEERIREVKRVLEEAQDKAWEKPKATWESLAVEFRIPLEWHLEEMVRGGRVDIIGNEIKTHCLDAIRGAVFSKLMRCGYMVSVSEVEGGDFLGQVSRSGTIDIAENGWCYPTEPEVLQAMLDHVRGKK